MSVAEKVRDVVDRARGLFISDRYEIEKQEEERARDAERRKREDRVRRLGEALKVYDESAMKEFLAAMSANLATIQTELVVADDLNVVLRLQGRCRAIREIVLYPETLRAEYDEAVRELMQTDAG